MSYSKVDLNNWPRKEHFEIYRHQTQCTFSLTTDIDVTAVLSMTKEKQYRFYAVMIYLLSKTANAIPAFRMCLKDDELVLWDHIHPSYTIFNNEIETFYVLWTEYRPTLDEFMARYLSDEHAYRNSVQFSPKPSLPKNHINISSIPWVEFSGFNLNIANVTDYFHPIFTMGKYTEKNGRIMLPLAIQVHHAVCDGFHVGQFVNHLKDLCQTINRP